MLQAQKKHIWIITYLLWGATIAAQNIDLATIGKGNALKLSGAVSTNSIFYNSNQNTGREAFTYFVQGSINVGFYQFSMPISYSYSNQGSQLDFQVPFKFNRLSLHPKYKWIQAHIGDVTMSFSPYTLNGHLFTGGGVDLTPKGNFKISAMAGRLLKAVEDDEDARTIPAFSRFGYGVKLGYDANKFAIGTTVFYAKDNINSITVVPEDKGVTPKENLVLSLEGGYRILENLEFKAEYAATAITQDLRANSITGNGQNPAGLFFDNRASTEYHNAIKTALDYSFGKAKVGIGYERIDPGYQTLGAYFFNNDFENITLNTSSTFFNDKLNLGFNIGYQRDDLNNQKEQATNRTVGAVNATYSASKQLTITGSYSNFSTFTNARLDQFETINDDNLLDNADEQFDYRQLSQNANLNVNYSFIPKEKLQQNINFNYALADVSNEQGGIVRIGDASTFHNINTSYTMGFPKKGLNITTAFNGTLNTIGTENATTIGPTLSVAKKLFDNKLNTGVAASYNTTKNTATTNSVTNFRVNASYVYKEKHNFNLNAIQLFRTVPDANSQEITVTFGYNYSFNIGGIKRERRTEEERETNAKEAPEDNVEVETLSVSYKDYKLEGTREQITQQLIALLNSPEYAVIKDIETVKVKSFELEKQLKDAQNKGDSAFKSASLDYLKHLQSLKALKATYHQLVFNSLKRLSAEVAKYDGTLEAEYLNQQAKINTAKAKGEMVSEANMKRLELQKKAYTSHVWIKTEMASLNLERVKSDAGVLNAFKTKYMSKVISMLNEKKAKEEAIEVFIEKALIAFYHEKSKEVSN